MFTWSVPQAELDPLGVDLKTGRVVFKHCGNVTLKEKHTEFDVFPVMRSRDLRAVSLRRLTSGKQSLANTWSSAVFPHWLSPTTTILHFTLWLASMLDFREDFWPERLSFIELRSREMGPQLGGRLSAGELPPRWPGRLSVSAGVSVCSEPVETLRSGFIPPHEPIREALSWTCPAHLRHCWVWSPRWREKLKFVMI